MRTTNCLTCIVGKSGSGKTTLANNLENLGFKVVESYTTRPPRTPNEKGHTFITPKEFKKLQNIVSYTKFNGYEYCVTKDMLDENDIFVVDPAGVKYLKEHYNGNIFVIALKCDESELVRRMRERGDSEDAIKSRVQNDMKMFVDLYDTSVSDVIIDITDCTPDETLREALFVMGMLDKQGIAVGDDAVIYGPSVVDVSHMNFFDELEYESWELFKKYANAFGYQVLSNDEYNGADTDENFIDFSIAKEIQEKIIEIFEREGVKFRYGKNC